MNIAMILRGTDYGHVWGASGVQGFFGEGYWFHRIPLRRPDFSGMTFVAKTTTVHSHRGNMPLRGDHTPEEFFPECIIVNPFRKIVLNAVGLSNPGAYISFFDKRWQERTWPFVNSFASVGETVFDRLRELREFVTLFTYHLPYFKAPVALQLNFSCPNTGVAYNPNEFLAEVKHSLTVAEKLNIPLIPKLDVSLPIEIAYEISLHPACDAICVSNALRYGALPEKIPWEKIFGKTSPLARFGGGALSGKYLFPLVVKWVDQARTYGITKPINAGGGVLSPRDAKLLFVHGASSVFLGSVALLHPRRVQKIIREVNTMCEKKPTL